MVPALKVHDGRVVADSRDIAQAFGKQHFHVLRDIDRLLKLRPDLASNFGCKIDRVATGKGASRETRYFEVTRDGFTLLVMGFTGADALDWKLAYIEAFNRLEAALRSLPGRREPVALPDDIADRQTLLAECRALRRTHGIRAAREHLMASGRFEHIRHIHDEVVEAEAVRQLPAPVAKPLGLLWRWADDCGVRPNAGVGTPLSELLNSYLNWCLKVGAQPLSDRLFAEGLKNAYGHEPRRRLYPLEIAEIG